MAANAPELRDSFQFIRGDNDFLLKNLIWNYPQLITQPTSDGDLLLHYAVKQGKLKAVKVLLGVDDLEEKDMIVRMINFFGWWLPPKNNVNEINLANKEGKTPLHYAAVLGHVEIAMLLLENGADVNRVDKDGKTPLHYAAVLRHVEIAMLLLENGADVNRVDKDGKTPLHHAVCWGKVEIVRLLLENGADANLVNKDGKTPLHYAADRGYVEIAMLLLENGADINLADTGYTRRYAGTQHDKGKTPLHYAAEQGHVEIAKLLLGKGAEVNLEDDYAFTPLHFCAVVQGNVEGNVEIARLLLEKGADVNRVDKDGQTPLHHAIRLGKVDIVRLLLKKGADANLANNDGQTPLHIANTYSTKTTGAIRNLLKTGVLEDTWFMENYRHTFYSQWLPKEKIDEIKELIEGGADSLTKQVVNKK